MKITAKLIKTISSSVRSFDEQQEFTNVFIDSREKTDDGLFIPIIGERFDGHDFLISAINNGAKAAFWQQDHQVPEEVPQNFPLFFVEDSQVALHHLASLYLGVVKPIVIGITGSNGKTSTKDIVESVLSTTYKTHKTKGNFNNHIGLPLTVLSMATDCELLILEMGMSNYGEISLLSKIAKPNYAIVTNIGESHIEQLGSREGIAKAKMEIVDGLVTQGKVLIDGDEPLLSNYYSNRTIRCGYGINNDVVISSYQANENGFTFHLNNKSLTYFIPLIGKHNVKNATYAIALAKELKIDETLILKGLQTINLTGMRLEKMKGMNNSVIINDAYNASPTSMKAAIESLIELNGYSKKILVLGDMYELGSDEEALHRSVAHVIRYPITHVFTIGEKGKWIIDELQKQSRNTMVVKSFENKEDVVKVLHKELDEKSIILFKASRGMKLESVITEITEQARGEN